MKIVKCCDQCRAPAASMSLLQIDQFCKNNGYKIVRFVIGREAKTRHKIVTKPERRHILIVASA